MPNLSLGDIKIDAIAFDLDGVIIDSPSWHAAAWVNAFSEMGLDVPELDFLLLEGKKEFEIIQEVVRCHGLRVGDDILQEICEDKKRKFVFSYDPQLVAGVIDVLLFFKDNNLPLALVTGNSRETVAHIFAKLNIQDFFDTVILGEDVISSKPSPEPYLKACSNLSISSVNALVFENSPLGIKSAKASRAQCIALATSLPLKYLSEADVVFSNYKDVLTFFERA